MAATKRPVAVIRAESQTTLQQLGHAWLGHLRADGRSVKTLYGRERNLFAIVLPHLAERGVTKPDEITSRGSRPG